MKTGLLWEEPPERGDPWSDPTFDAVWEALERSVAGEAELAAGEPFGCWPD